MNTARRHRRFASWLALVAIAAMALLPTLSHALARAAGGTGFAEVCTPQGTKIVALADAETAPSGVVPHLEHCPYCALGGAAGLPPPPPALAVPDRGAGIAPPLLLQAPRTLFAWATANPRAPPISS